MVKIKCLVAKDILLAYTDLNKWFYMHTNSINYQLVTVVIQEGKPIMFYSCNITGTCTRYPVRQNKLLSIVETLKRYCTILLLKNYKYILHTKYQF